MANPRTNIQDFTTFCDYFFICTHGKKDFKLKAQGKRVSSFTSISSEAFTIAYIQNSYDNWLDEANDTTVGITQRKENSATYRKKMWTENANSSKKYCGWDKEGLIFYMKKAREVQTGRNSGQDFQLEVDYITNAKRMFGRKVRGPRAPQEETDLELEVMYDDEEEDNEDEPDEVNSDDEDDDSDSDNN